MFKTTVLDNGLTVLTATMPHTRSVSLCVFVGAGSRYESDELAGAAHFIEHLLFKGTKRWPTAKELSEAVEGVGGLMNASTDREMTVFWVKVASIHFQRALDVLAEAILRPLMDGGEMEKERRVILEELNMTNDYPSYRVDQLLDEALWPDQPLGRDVGGTTESVLALTRDGVLEFMAHQYVPTNVTIAVAGDVAHDKTVEAVANAFEVWATSQTPLSWYPVEDSNRGPSVRVEYRKTDQAHICLGLPGLSQDHPDRYPLNLLNVILGEGMSSRLFVELRERQGLAYDVHSGVSHMRDCGAVVIYCGVQPQKSRQAIRSIMEQLEGLKKGMPQEELDKARELVKGRLLLRMEDSRNVAMWMGAQQLLQGHVHTVESVVKQLNKITTDDLQRVAKAVIDIGKLKLAVVGPYRSPRSFERLLQG